MLKTIAAEYSELTTLVEIIQKRAAYHPDKVAYTFLENSEEVQKITYRDLDLKAKAIAQKLRKNLKKGDRVLLLYKPGLEYIIGFFGCLYAGVIAVPAYPPDPSRLGRMLPRLLSIVEDCNPKLIMTTSDISKQLKLLCVRAPQLLIKSWLSSDKVKAIAESDYLQEPLSPRDISFLQYTSGSTGKPKGVMITHENLIHNSETIHRAGKNPEGDRLLTWLPLYHDMGLIGIVIQTVYAGLSAWVMSPFDFLRNPYNWLYAISKYRISVTGGPNFAYHLCHTKVTDEQKKNLDLSSWKMAYSGAEPIREETMISFLNRFSDVGFSKKSLYTCYGLAESTVFVTGSRLEHGFISKKIDSEELKVGKVSAINEDSRGLAYVSSGTALLEDTVIKIVNSETRQECGVNEVGEIWISSPSVAAGYWGKDTQSKEVFENQILGDKNKYLKTGDLAFVDSSGEYFITGRIKDLIIINGQNHYPSDIEETIVSTSSEIRPGCLAAIAVKDKTTEKVVLIAELRKNLSFEKMESLKGLLRKSIFKRHDLALADVVFIKSGTIPKTTSGKIQRNATKEAYVENKLLKIDTSKGQPKFWHSFVNKNVTTKESNSAESVMISILAQELGAEPSSISASTEFGELGISSLQAVSAAAKLSEHFQVEVTPALFWSYKNVSSFAKHLQRQVGSLSTHTPGAKAVTQTKHMHTKTTSAHEEDIAIIGMSGRFPGAENLEQFWQNLCDGVDSISQERGPWAGYLKDIDKFDPLFFGISPREAEVMDPQQRITLQVVWEALERSGIAPSSLSGTPTGIFIGVSSSDYADLIKSQKITSDLQVATGNAHSIIANRISFLMNLKGPSLAIDTACSSSLVAVHEAVKSLKFGDCNIAISCGVNILIDESITDTFAKAGMLSPESRCFTFDKKANGYVRGEGCGAIVLKPLNAALKDRNPILGVIRATGVEHGGLTNSLTAPSALSQAELIERTYMKAQVHPETIGYIEAHGTATKLGDPIELLGLQMAFEKLNMQMDKRPHMVGDPCFLGSVKSNIGHLEAAAGIAGFIKVVMMLQKKKIPKTLHFNELNPSAKLNANLLAVNDSLRAWVPRSHEGIILPRRAGVSSFGFGGVNAHVVVEEFLHFDDIRVNTGVNGKDVLLIISAKTAERLVEYAHQYVHFLTVSKESIESISYSSQVGRDSLNYRLAVIGRSSEELLVGLQAFLRKSTGNIFLGYVKKVEKKDLRSDFEIGLAEVAQAWCSGERFAWRALYSQLPRMCVLPTYPFVKQKYWIEVQSKMQLRVQLKHDQFYLKDHVVVDKNILPGVVHLEMVRKTAAKILNKKAAVIRNVLWKQPIVVGGNALNVDVRFKNQTESSVSFEIISNEGDSKVYSEGVVEFSHHAYEKVKATEEFFSLNERIKKFDLKEDVYEHFADVGLKYGPSFQCIKKIYSSDSESYAELDLDEIHLKNEMNFELHPSLMDAALGACIGIKEISQGPRDRVYIPFSMEKIELYKTVNEKCFAHAKISENQGDVVSDIMKYDVTVFSGHGDVLVRFLGVVVRPVILITKSSAGQLLELTRKLKPISTGVARKVPFKDIVLINFESEQVDQFKQIANARVRMLNIVPQVDLFAVEFRNLIEILSRDIGKHQVGELHEPWALVINLERYEGDTAVMFLLKLYQTLAHSSENIAKVTLIPILKAGQTFDFSRKAEVRGFASSLQNTHPKIELNLMTLDESSVRSPEYCKIIFTEMNIQKSDEIVYFNSTRHQYVYSKTSPNKGSSLLKPGGVYLISGGAGGVGQILAHHLYEKWNAKVFVLGRRSSEDVKVSAHSTYIQCDITNRHDIQKAIAEVSAQAGRINGIIHAAGVVNKKSVLDSSWEEYSQTLAAKVDGCLLLDEATADYKLDFFTVTSSISSFMGDFGAGDYASANAFLDSFIEVREDLVARGVRYGKSIGVNWPLWQSGGMSMPDEQRDISEKYLGLTALPTKEALKAFENSLMGEHSHWIVMYGDSKKIMRNLGMIPAVEKSASGSFNKDIEEKLCVILSETLKIDEEIIDPDADLTEYGVDSMTMIDFMDRVKKIYGDVITPAVLFENKQIRALAEVIGQNMTDGSANKDQDDVKPQKISKLNSEVMELDHPLSKAQEAMWFIYEMSPQSHSYNIPVGLKINSRMEKLLVKRTLEVLSQEQPLLRSIFIRADEIRQVVLENCGVRYRTLDGSKWTEEQIQEEILAEAQQPFELSVEPGFRALLVSRSDEKHDLVMTAHHIAFDGLSLMLLLKRFIVIYNKLSAGAKLDTALVDSRYFKFIEEQRQFLASQEADNQLKYWKNRLSGELPLLQLPMDRLRPPVQTYNGSTYNFTLDKELFEKVKDAAKKEKITVNALLLSSFYVFLNKFSGQSDFVVGSPVLGRTPQMMETIGYFVNMLPLREKIDTNLSVRSLTHSVHRNVGESLLNQQYPFPLLVDKMKMSRDPSRSPLFQVCFVFQNMLKDALFEKSTQPKEFEYFHIAQQEGQFDLELEVLDSANHFTCHLKFNTDLFDDSTVRRFAKSYETILKTMVNDGNKKISDISSLDEQDLDLILNKFNATIHNYQEQHLLHELFETQAASTPDAIAVTFRGQELSYKELNERANKLAHHLIFQGILPDSFVGICVERSLEMVVSLYAVLKAGGAYVPVEPTYPKKRIQFLFKDSNFRYVLTQEKFKGLVSEFCDNYLCVDSDWRKIESLSLVNPKVSIRRDHLAYMIYTSGSTGEPKGAMNTHEGICNRLLWMQNEYRLRSDDTVLQKTPFSFDVSVWEFFWPLITGAKMVVLEPEAHKDASHVAKAIAKEKVTTVHFVPSMLSVFVDQDDLASRCHSLRRVICSGEALPMDLQQRFFNEIHCELHNLYGPTEASVDVTYWACDPKSTRSYVPIGKPIHNIQMHILDQNFKPVPVGVGGELCIAGVGLARGYHNRPDLNAEKFIVNPLDSSGETRLYRTGDLARYAADGVIEYLGRIDNQVKIRGFRIELGEIEALLGQHPMVKENVVVARSSYSSEKELVAYIVPIEKKEISPKDLRQYLKKELPEYMVPAKFMFLWELPLSSNGKVDRKLLPEPKGLKSEQKNDLILPRTDLEMKICAIWMQGLGLDKVGVSDNFFDLGGNSLLSIRIVRDLNRLFETQLNIRDFYENPTIEALAARIEGPTGFVDMTERLLADSVLDTSITYKEVPVVPNKLSKIFLTGVTGFLGAYLLRDLLENTEAEILCLVRSSDDLDGARRIQENLEKYHIWKPGYKNRIFPIKGDLGQPMLGISKYQWSYLAEKTEVVYHNAAKVNFVQPYSYLKNENVLGTQEVLRLCGEGGTKPLHYVSTVSVFDSSIYKKTDQINEGVPAQPVGLFSGYAQSKWVAEELVKIAQDRGLPVCVYRPGTVTGDSVTGISNPDDLMTRLLVAAVQLQCLPQLDRSFDMVPVDFVSEAIIKLSLAHQGENKMYHLVNPCSLHMKELKELYIQMGYQLKDLGYSEWSKVLIEKKDNALNVLLPLFTENVPGTSLTQAQLSETKPMVRASTTLNDLKNIGLHCPEIDKGLITLYLSQSLPKFLDKKAVS